ncbi:rRNA maturation RNase YbeY [Ruegeria lacuscaerulensis]|uniref:rRNA maturation RNase YbeY n=1 Tax=Ruegeria lacuscaerulensis TaxID=55218 RepID=UPI00147AC71A|nr:rRNA maturation RNase YbeY [Ruegeria lacuscaerulensis]
MAIELTVEDPRWRGLEALVDRAAQAVFHRFDLDADLCEVSVLACDDAHIAALNAEFREKPSPTNVLSWPAEDLSPEAAGDIPDHPQPDFTGEIALGDIAISFDTCTREAAEAGKPMDDHVTHLIIHGLLHLLGYDHIRDPDATLMEGLEVEILGKMGIDNPYIV